MSETPEMPRSEAPEPASRRSGRGIRIALAVSLALNLLVVGLVGGAMLGRDGPGEGPAIRSLGLGPFALVLPRDARQDVRRRIEAGAPDLNRNRAEIGRSLVVLRRALLAEPFDRDVVARALARSREAASALQAQGHGALLETLEAMSPAQRAVVAERLQRSLRHMARRADGARSQ